MEKRSKKMQLRIVAALERITNWFRELGSEPEKTDTPSLLPLTPKFDPERHGMYVEVIEAALGADDTEATVRNLALTGSYGVGKSSILEEVRRQHGSRAISISLSTLGFAGDESAGGIAATKTNRIQKEIVKQLLYSEDPVKMPGSRYHRVSRFRFWREFGLALLLAVPLTFAFFLLGWTASIGVVLPLPKELSLVTNVMVFAGLTLLLLGLRFVSYNRIHISQLTAGKATIALSPQSATYFDEYLDEIVYFFEKVDCDLVIFEDIDRFDDAHIFETLRSLNSILNGAKQLRGRPIRFIYAIKDSIFDQLGVRAAEEELSTADPDESDKADSNGHEVAQADAAEAEVARANRTKFFDLVVPVVPFITHRSARDLLVEKMKDLDHKVSLKLIDLAARHVADMRLIKNVRNEFAIFKRQIIDKGSLQLTQTGLFAMMLYKSTHLSDFELIRLGRSNLDTIYQASRDLVNQSLKSLNTTIARDRRAMHALQPGTGRGAAFGAAFANHIAQVMTYVSGTRVSYQYQGGTVPDAELLNDTLWVKVADAQDAITVIYRTPSSGQQSFNVDHGQLAEIIGDSLSADAWKKAERQRLTESIATATSKRDFLASADMRDLMAHPEHKVVLDRKEMTFEQVVCSTLKSDLAVELVRAGHIDRNYTLYTSTFYAERVSANAMNFMIKSVDPQLIDMAFKLKPNDVRAVLRERPEILQQRAAYNISLLDYLLEKDSRRADALIAQLVNYSDEQRDFVHAYLETGTKKVELVQGLASRWGGVYKLLVSEASLPDEERIRLVDVALRSAQTTVDYALGEDVRSFFGIEYRSLTSFTSDATTPDRAALLAEHLVKSALWLSDLEPLGASVREAVVSVGVYKITNTNLVLA